MQLLIALLLVSSCGPEPVCDNGYFDQEGYCIEYEAADDEVFYPMYPSEEDSNEPYDYELEPIS